MIIGFVVTFTLLSMGMCALWCRRQYKKHFIEERRQRESHDEIVAGQVHHGMYKNEDGDWEIVDNNLGGRLSRPEAEDADALAGSLERQNTFNS